MMIYIYTNVMMLKEKLIYQFKENNFDNKKKQENGISIE